MHLPEAISLGFDFYGSGNIGDDLMLAGFLDAVADLSTDQPPVYARSRANVTSQKKRFPKVNWTSSAPSLPHRSPVDWPQHLWAGVGDTPFQLTCGSWFLDYLQAELSQTNSYQRRVLVNIGAETEIKSRTEDFSQVARSFDAISVRDQHTYDILVQTLQVPAERVFCSADLAHISLSKTWPVIPTKTKRLGLIIAGDTLSKNDLREVSKFVVVQPEPVSFIAQEVRKERFQESFIYEKLANAWFSKFRHKAVLDVPDYEQAPLADLMRPIADSETLLSSRYHGLLIGAWAGCKLGAIGRSSKVTALARELNIPYCIPPVTFEKLKEVKASAVKVDPKLLQRLALTATRGVSFAINLQGDVSATITHSSVV